MSALPLALALSVLAAESEASHPDNERGVALAPQVLPSPSTAGAPVRGSDLRRWVGWGSLGLSGASLTTGALVSLQAWELRNGAHAVAPREELTQRNAQALRLDRLATTLYAAGGAVGVLGAGLLLMSPKQGVRVMPTLGGRRGTGLTLKGRF